MINKKILAGVLGASLMTLAPATAFAAETSSTTKETIVIGTITEIDEDSITIESLDGAGKGMEQKKEIIGEKNADADDSKPSEDELPELSEDELSEGELPEGELPELSEDELPEGELPEGELPEGQMPGNGMKGKNMPKNDDSASSEDSSTLPELSEDELPEAPENSDEAAGKEELTFTTDTYETSDDFTEDFEVGDFVTVTIEDGEVTSIEVIELEDVIAEKTDL